MKKVFIPLVLFVVFPTFIWADMSALNQVPDAAISLGVLKIPGSQIMQHKAVVQTIEGAVITPTRKSIRFQSLVNEIMKENSKNDLILKNFSVGDHYGASTDFLSEVSPDYTIKRGFLSLTKIPNNRRKEAFMFTFLMNKGKDHNQPAAFRNPFSPHMHVMGSKKMFQEQKVIENEYPVDISVAKYEDGYSSEEVNFVLPNKKPREVMVSLLWSF